MRVPVTPETVPSAIWMPATARTLPACYQGSPFEMVVAMAAEMKPGLSPQEAIDQLLVTLCENRRFNIEIPAGPPEHRAMSFIAALVACGIARPMPKA